MVTEEKSRQQVLVDLMATPNKPSLWKRYLRAVVAHREAMREKGNTGQTFEEFGRRRNILLREGAREEVLDRITRFVVQEDLAGRIDWVKEYLEGE